MSAPTRFDGDIAVRPSLDGGAITIRAGQPDMEQGLSTAVYLSLYTEPGWWGNSILLPEQRLGEEDSLEELESEPLSNKVRQDYEERARKRLAWMVSSGAAKTVTCAAVILSQFALQLTVTIEEPDGTTSAPRYKVNWQGQRAALGVS
jgi:phage gp46-like protein